MTQGFFLAPARGEGASLSAGLGGGPDRVDNLPVLRHGPMIAHILDTAITCSGPQDPRLFTLLENDQMAQVNKTQYFRLRLYDPDFDALNAL